MDASSLEQLLPLLQETDLRVRKDAMSSLARLGDPRAAEALIELLNETPEISMHAASCLGSMRAAAAVPKLVLLAQRKNYPVGMRTAAIDALRSIGDPSAVDGLLPLLSDTTSEACEEVEYEEVNNYYLTTGRRFPIRSAVVWALQEISQDVRVRSQAERCKTYEQIAVKRISREEYESRSNQRVLR